MPTHASDASSTVNTTDLSTSVIVCPLPVNRVSGLDDNESVAPDAILPGSAGGYAVMAPPVSNNTAAGMSMMQEDSMYMDSDPVSVRMDVDDEERESEGREACAPDDESSFKSSTQPEGQDIQLTAQDCQMPDTPVSMGTFGGAEDVHVSRHKPQRQETDVTNTQLRTPSPEVSMMDGASSNSTPKKGFCGTSENPGIPFIDQELNHTSDALPWEFSHRQLETLYPSSLFQACSKYRGTQQSDRQIYNVEVTVLTVNVEQCTMSGYLEICGLTPDHPTLTTFFTGEIIGGPDQKYSFRTNNPQWGASDKTDITHWARFPAWRSLSSHAKKNINFVYPLDQAPWWQQENIFMRWKEHFLVPDYKLKSIQGASFEGFYYICLNQIEGRISGVYFHSKSEKYQQLELKHDGKQGVWGKGVCPSVEFR